MRRVHKRKEFDIVLDFHHDDVISPPTVGQRDLLIGSSLAEMADDIEHLGRISKTFVESSPRPSMDKGWAQSDSNYDDARLEIQGQQVMQSWEERYMQAMAKVVGEAHGDVMEVGFGMGISADFIQQNDVRSHTIIEVNEGVRGRFDKWRERYPSRDIRLEIGRWQDVIDNLGTFDGIFFDTYPMTEKEYAEYVIGDITYANHFFEAAHRQLDEGGVLTYFSMEIDSVSRRHQRRLFELFDSVTIRVVRDLKPPADCNYWWADSMVVIAAVK